MEAPRAEPQAPADGLEQQPLKTVHYFECVRCGFLCTQLSRVEKHVRGVRCRGSPIAFDRITGVPIRSRLIPPPADATGPVKPRTTPKPAATPSSPEQDDDPPAKFKACKKKTLETPRLPSGLDGDGPGFDERLEHLRTPRITRAVFGKDTPSVALAMFRELWGPNAPPHFQSLSAPSPRRIVEIGQTVNGVTELMVHDGASAERDVFVRLFKTFRRLALGVDNRLYSKRVDDFLAELGIDGVDLTIEDVFMRNDTYWLRRRRTNDLMRVKVARALRGDMCDMITRRRP